MPTKLDGRTREARAARAQGMNPAQMMIAKYANQMEESFETYEDDDTKESGADTRIVHKRPRTATVFKLTPSGSVPVQVSVQSLGGPEGVLLSSLYSPVCHDCGQSSCGPGVNDCPGRPPRVFRVCPVTGCGKRIYDSKPTGKHLSTDGMSRPVRGGEDEGLIDDNAYEQITPAMRTKAALDLHLLGYHKDEAAALGLRAAQDQVQTPVAVG